MAAPERLVRAPGKMLEQSDIAHYLLSLGLVKPRAVVEEDLTIVDASRRNCVFLASTRAGPTYVVKQAGPRNAATLAHEAAVLRALAGRAPSSRSTCPRSSATSRRRRGSSCGRPLARATGAITTRPAASRACRRGCSAVVLAACTGFPPDGCRGASAGRRPHVGPVAARAALRAAARPERRSAGSRRASAGEPAAVRPARRAARVRARRAPRARRPPLGQLPGASRRRLASQDAASLLVDWELAGAGAAEFDVGTVSPSTCAPGSARSRSSIPRIPDRLADRARHPLPARSGPRCRRSGRPTRRQPAVPGTTARDRADGGPAPADRGGACAGTHRAVGARRDAGAARRQHAPRSRGCGAEPAGAAVIPEPLSRPGRRGARRRDDPRADPVRMARSRQPAAARRRSTPSSTGPGAARYLVSCLREELYWSFYCHGRPVPARWGEPEPVSRGPLAGRRRCRRPTPAGEAGSPDGPSSVSRATRRS